MKIRELLTDESKWTKGEPWRDKFGNGFNTPPELRVCWSLVGAAVKCYGWEKYDEVMDRIENKVGATASQYNDDPARTFAEVKALVEELDV